MTTSDQRCRHSWWQTIPVWIFLVAGMGLSHGCSDDDGDSLKNSHRIGLLLPFTGRDAAVGSGYERAALMARDRINDAGGIGGKRLAFVTRDTHSDVARIATALEETLGDDVSAVIGPENYEAARLALPEVASRQTTLISPVVSGSATMGLLDEYSWIRLAPSAAIMGRAFANHLKEIGVSTLSVVYSNEDYNLDFVGALVKRHGELGGTLTTSLFIDQDQLSFSDEISALKESGSSHLVLSAPIKVAASFVNEVTMSGQTENWKWYLSPLLETPVFPLNTIHGALDGAIGIGIDVQGAPAAFIKEYSARWNGVPDDGAYFYYDAVAILALGMEYCVQHYGDLSYEGILEGILDVSLPSGIQVRWDELDEGLLHIRNGKSVYYSGLTGPLLFDEYGQQQVAPMKIWNIKDGDIVKDIEL